MVGDEDPYGDIPWLLSIGVLLFAFCFFMTIKSLLEIFA